MKLSRSKDGGGEDKDEMKDPLVNKKLNMKDSKGETGIVSNGLWGR